VTALEKAGLKDMLEGTDKYTLFAPTNSAFDEAVTDLGEDSFATLLERADLEEILKYHVVSDEIKAAELEAGTIPSYKDLAIPVTVNETTKTVGGAEVTMADVMATNGVVHVINQVMLRPSLADVLSADDEFSTLVKALNAASLTAIFGYTKVGPMYEVFAPTNAAFAALIQGSTDIADEAALLALPNLGDILKYHVVPRIEGAVTQLPSYWTAATLLTTANLTVVDPEEDLIVNGHAMIEHISAGNGDIYKIGAVLMPPPMDSTDGDTDPPMDSTDGDTDPPMDSTDGDTDPVGSGTNGAVGYGLVVVFVAILCRVM